MLNQLVIVGRLVNTPTIIEEEGKKLTKITIAVPRNYKNEDGIYETDFIDCELWGQIAEKTMQYCSKGDLIGVKGSVRTKTIEKETEKTKEMYILAEKITCLNSTKPNENEE